MSIASIPKKFDESSPAVRNFLEPRKKDHRKEQLNGLREALSEAFVSPDRRPQAEPQETSMRPVPVPPPAPVQESKSPAIQVKEPEAARPRRPALPPAPEPVSDENRRSAEKTYSVDPEKHELMVMLANMEGLRLRRNIPTSRILDSLLDLAFSFVDMEKGEVIPTKDGRGLHPETVKRMMS